MGDGFTMQRSEMSQIITETSCRRCLGCWRQSPVSPTPSRVLALQARVASPTKTFLLSFSTNLYVWRCQRNYKRGRKRKREKGEKERGRLRGNSGSKLLEDRGEREREACDLDAGKLPRPRLAKVLHGRSDPRWRGGAFVPPESETNGILLRILFQGRKISSESSDSQKMNGCWMGEKDILWMEPRKQEWYCSLCDDGKSVWWQVQAVPSPYGTNTKYRLTKLEIRSLRNAKLCDPALI